MQDLKRRRQAILALAWFGGLYFLGWIGVCVAQASYHGYGLVRGRVIEGEVGDQTGNGWFIDALLLLGAFAICGLIVGAWAWVSSRLTIGTEPILSDAEVEEQPFYLVDIPRITSILIAVGIACMVGVALCGAAIFPLILINYGI